MKFPLERFKTFCSMLLIDTKERGQILLSWENMLSTQRYFIEEIAAGLAEHIHFFVILKGRQEGITTICAALDLFWHYEYPGMQGTFAAQDEDTKNAFRRILTAYHNGIPKKYRVRRLNNNRSFMNWANRSSLAMQIGGAAKGGSGKGRGQAFTYIHATECSSWEDEESLASMLASLADLNPLRLQIFESTARGMNLFKDMWDDAGEAVTQRRIFIGWWRNELYRRDKDSNEYRVYWDGQFTPQEEEWVRAVKQLYDVDIEPEQIAWWRWNLAEKIHDEDLMMQEYPPTEDYAFILSGKNFFSMPKVQEIITRIEAEDAPSHWRFAFSDVFIHTNGTPGIEASRCEPRLSQLQVWEEPDDAGIYSIGGDPAYGSETWADRSVVEVYRCYADRFEQVAEFCTPEITTRKYAWVICFLSGYYRNSMLNLEVNGPGQSVLGEIDNLRREASVLASQPVGRALRDVVGHMKYFLYKKLDSPFGGGVYHWQTTAQSKDRAFNTFRDLVDTNEAVLHSEILAREMKIIVREENGFLGASGRGKDDCTVASAIAAENYTRHMRLGLKRMGASWNKERSKRERVREVGVDTPMQATARKGVGQYMQAIGMKYGPKEE